jgi:predicted dehydrogenase
MPAVESVRLFDYTLNPGIQVEDAALAIIRLTNDVVITLEMGWRMHLEKDIIYTNFFGQKGAAYLNPLRINKELHENLVNVTPMISEKGSDRYLKAYDKEISHFYKVIQGKEQNLSPAGDAHQIMSIIEALYESSRTGKEIYIRKS